MISLAASLVATGASGDGSTPHRYLLVWAGDWNAGDLSRGALVGTGAREITPALAQSAPVGPDFLAVIDAEPASPSYGKVVNTIVVPGTENEPHHMQYRWQHGDRVFAGGLFSDATFVFDVDDLPNVRLVDVVEPLETPCGSVPDAYWVLSDGTALGTYMGGPNAVGDPRCNGGVNNGFAGTPGTVVRIAPDGTVLGEFPAAGDPTDPPAADLRPNRCSSTPPLARPSCANPHGIQAREDLGIVITSDYAEPRNVPIDPLSAPDNRVFRDTVRVWDIVRDGDDVSLRLRSVSALPIGAAGVVPPDPPDARGVMGVMETTVTNLPHHRGAFASSMCGGQIYYTPDVTVPQPVWRQVFDASTAAEAVAPGTGRTAGCVGAGWLQTSPDDTVLFQAVIGRSPGTLSAGDPGVPKMVYAIDIRPLVDPSSGQSCAIDTAAEIVGGGGEPTCPRFLGALSFDDPTTGGPHWGAIDPFSLDDASVRRTSVGRIATSNYFVARAGLDGDHRVCIANVAPDGSLALDQAFRDERTSEPCVDFDRMEWPHGRTGWAKPHSMLFVTR